VLLALQQKLKNCSSSNSSDLCYVADRILSVVWYEPENVIITGGVDCIRVWSLSSGQAVKRLDAGRVAAQVHTYIYAVCVTEYVAELITLVMLSL